MKTTSCTEFKRYAFDSAKRCGARTKRNNGQSCKAPAVAGKQRCRMHGGAKGSGAKEGNQNALKHGLATREIMGFKKVVRQTLAECRNIEIGTLKN